MHTAHTFFTTAAHRLYLAGLFLLPTAVLWSFSVSAQPLKMMIATVALVGSVALVALGCFKRGGLSIPMSAAFGAVWLIPLAYVVSALSGSTLSASFIGAAIDVDTVFFMALAALAFSVPFAVFHGKQDYLRAFFVLLAAGALLALFHLVRLFGGPEMLAFDVITNPLFSPVGKWNDLSIFFGLTALSSLIALESLTLRAQHKYMVVGTLVVSLFFMALINFVPVWVVVGLAALGMVLYRFVVTNRDGYSMAATLVFVIALIAVIFSGSFGASLGRAFAVEQIEARPSWESTLTVARSTLAESPIVGSGPNTFLTSWDTHRPALINESVFWNADFASGVGLVPTSLVSTGLLGLVAWIVFLVSLVLLAVRALLLRSAQEQSHYFVSLATFVGGAYLIVMSVVYLPSPQLILIGFALLGMFAAFTHRESGRDFEINFKERPRLGFVAVLGLALTLVVSVLVTYGAGTVFASNVAYEKAARAAQVTGNLELATSHITDAITLYPQDRYYRLATLIHVARVNAILSSATPTQNQSELQAQFQSELGAAVESGLLAVRYDGANYRNWQTLATAYQTVVPLNIQGSYEAAVTALDTAKGLHPTMPTIPYQRAQLEAAKGNTSAIREYVEAAVALKQDFTPALLLLAQLELDNGNLKAAISRAESASVFEPSNAVLHFQVGVLKFESKDYAGARVAFERAVALANDYANARYYLGRTLLMLDAREQAEVEFREVLRLNPDNAEVQGIVASLAAGKDPFAPAPQKK